VKDKDYQRVYRKGATFFSKNLLVRTLDNEMAVARVGVVVSKKVAKKATDRNKIKRRIRELIRLKLAKLQKGMDYVFVPKRTFILAKFSENTKDMEIILKKATFKH